MAAITVIMAEDRCVAPEVRGGAAARSALTVIVAAAECIAPTAVEVAGTAVRGIVHGAETREEVAAEEVTAPAAGTEGGEVSRLVTADMVAGARCTGVMAAVE